MKKLIIILISMLTTVYTLGADRQLTKKEKKASCKIIQKISPSENQLSVKQCLSKFQFDLISETSKGLKVEAIGQTDEDVTTVCSIFLGEIAKNSTSFCTLE